MTDALAHFLKEFGGHGPSLELKLSRIAQQVKLVNLLST